MTPWHSGPRLPSDTGRHIPAHTRREVLARDGSTCRYCRAPDSEDIDHVYPWSQGGSHHPTNLVASCTTCNTVAGSKVFPEFILKRQYILARRAIDPGE